MTPQTDLVVTADLLDLSAAERLDAPAIVFAESGETWSWRGLREKVRAHAAGLQALGVRQDKPVLSWLPNGPLAILNLLALSQLGAICVPINPAYRGGLLAHVLTNTNASLMIAHGALIGRLADVDTAALQRVVVIGDERPALPGIELLPRAALDGGALTLQPPKRTIRAADTMAVIYTSGTTGPSKGVLASYRHLHAAALGFENIGPGDRAFNALPMHHVGGPISLLWALIHGGASVQAESFRTPEFWPLVRKHQVTTTGLLGAMARFLLDQPPSPDDKTHSLKSVIIAPFDEAAVAFGERFGVDVYTEFNMTEVSVPLWAGPNPTALGACGRPRGGYALRIVDDRDVDVAEGETGELILQPPERFAVSHGYLNDPAATAQAWRNGWFHTGDLFRRDADENYFFVDRAKDAIRRRGENISSFEVESAILLHPSVKAAAVVAAPGIGSEDEVLAVVVQHEGVTLDPAELLEFLRPRVAHFMLPRYVRMVADLPRTPTHKVEKHRLRAEGVTADTWDREAAGVVVKRDRLERRE